MSMPFYVSPAQAMRDKAEYARQGIARGRSGVVLQCRDGILFVAPNPSRALHKISEIYDRIAFAAVGRYNEYENLRKAGVTYADITGYQFDRHDVTARGIANWYAQTLGTIFTESPKPFEVEIVVAEVGASPSDDQIYRITFDGSVTDEPGFVAFGGQAVGLGGEEGVEELLDPGGGDRAGELARDPSIAEGLHGRDSLHAEGLRQHLVGIDVHLRQVDLAVAGADGGLQGGTELAARRAPLGPEVDDHGNLARALDHPRLEVRLRDVEDHESRVTGRHGRLAVM